MDDDKNQTPEIERNLNIETDTRLRDANPDIPVKYDFQEPDWVLPPFVPRPEVPKKESDITTFIEQHKARVEANTLSEAKPTPFVQYAENWQKETVNKTKNAWVQENFERFLMNTQNNYLAEVQYYKDYGFITCVQFSPNGFYIIVGYSSGLIDLRSGEYGTVIRNLRQIQFPPKPIYAIEFSPNEADVAYAACSDGAIYRITIPSVPQRSCAAVHCISVDRTLTRLKTQYYAGTADSLLTTPFIVQRTPALSLGIMACTKKMVVGYENAMIKIYDIETQTPVTTHKVQKLRLQYIPRKLRRLHTAPVCALRPRRDHAAVFVTAAWDRSLRIWDTRCAIGCVATFEGVNVVSDSIDINRNQCLVGSWQPSEALTVWDLRAKKRLNVIRAQNRRFDVDGEYIYACRYWRSEDYNRKGKYAIIGGSGTGCVEIINLHNRYISCSYPAEGAVLAVASHGARLVFGGTAPVLSVVTFHDPKHERDNLQGYSESFIDRPATFQRQD